MGLDVALNAVGRPEALRLTIVPALLVGLVLLLLGLVIQGRARHLVLALGGVAMAVSLIAWALYLPVSA